MNRQRIIFHPRTLGDVEAFMADLVEARLREFRTMALLFGGDDTDIESLDRIENESRADCEAAINTMRAALSTTLHRAPRKVVGA